MKHGNNRQPPAPTRSIARIYTEREVARERALAFAIGGLIAFLISLVVALPSVVCAGAL